MKIKGEEFITMKDIMSVYYSAVDALCFDELGKATMKIGVNVNDKQLKKWIDQAKFIEKFSVEDIRDAATRDLVYKTKQENQSLKDRWQKLKECIEERIKKYKNEFDDPYVFGRIYEQEDLLKKMKELEKE